MLLHCQIKFGIHVSAAAAIFMTGLALTSCQPDEDPVSVEDPVPSATTGEATNISCRNATLSGKVNIPQPTLTDLTFGILYSTSSEVLVGAATQIPTDSFDPECNYSVNTGVLESETTYCYRSYISQNGEITYGEVKSFTTLAVSSMLKTLEVSDINSSGATLNAMLDLTDCIYDSIEYGFILTDAAGAKKTLAADGLSSGQYSLKAKNILPESIYGASAYVKLDGRQYEGDKVEFTTLKPAIPEAVDLGLSVKWASFNLGASTPEEYGLYYQWGDTVGYGSDTSDGRYFNWKDKSGNVTYKWCDGSSTTLTKYNNDTSRGTVDNKAVLEPEDDVAHFYLGDSWRMPTDAEWTELRNTSNCSWTWTTLNGVKGYKVQSLKAGYTDNCIFLPAAGYRSNDSHVNAGGFGYYWSSSLYASNPTRVWDVNFTSSDVYRYYDYRCYGQSVRPVQK